METFTRVLRSPDLPVTGRGVPGGSAGRNHLGSQAIQGTVAATSLPQYLSAIGCRHTDVGLPMITVYWIFGSWRHGLLPCS